MSSPDPSSFDAVVAGPAFCLGIRCDRDAVTAIVFLSQEAGAREGEGELARRAADELRAYFADPAFRFALPLRAAGTPFRQRVWRAIAAISPGETRRYGDLARALGSAPRAVGQACGDNPLPVVVPCHRVVAAAGIGGFAHARQGDALAAKRWLLDHERRLARG